jgi:hypothetical protein
MIRIGVRSFVSAGGGTDADAQAFITAAGITDATQQSAINTLVTDLKGYGVWTKMKAIYPFVGGTSSTHKWNLKDPRDLDAAFRLVFSGGSTHSSTGWLPNGTNGYANSYFNPVSQSSSSSSLHLSYYARTQNNTGASRAYIGNGNIVSASSITALGFFAGGTRETISIAGLGAEYSPNPSLSRFTGMKFGTTNGTRSARYFKNGIFQASAVTQSSSFYNGNFFIGAANDNGTANYFQVVECAFASIGDGLTDTEAANFYTAVQAYQTTLSRNV